MPMSWWARSVALRRCAARPPRRSSGCSNDERLAKLAVGQAHLFRRAVAEAKAGWHKQRRTYRPWLPAPGQYLVIDWAEDAGRNLFCAVLAWSRVRFVRFGPDQTRATTLALLAECFEEIGGVPEVVLTDRMGCLKAGVVANVVVPHPEYVAFAARYGFRPDFCEGADPESKALVEHLYGYAQSDLLVPALLEQEWSDQAAANAAARAWCTEVNRQVHSEMAAVPAERLLSERQVLRSLPATPRPPWRAPEPCTVEKRGSIRFGSARYLGPKALVGPWVDVLADEDQGVIFHAGAEVVRHEPVGPGEVAFGDLADPHRRPTRGIRPRTAAELAFVGLGSAAEAFLRGAAAAGTLRLEHELAGIVELVAVWGREAVMAALERATRFRRFKASDVRAILEAGSGLPKPVRAGQQLMLDLPAVPVRPLSAYARVQGGWR